MGITNENTKQKDIEVISNALQNADPEKVDLMRIFVLTYLE